MDDIFGFRRKTKKQRKREQLKENIRKGKAAEDIAVMHASLQALSRGRIAHIERTGRGSDYQVRETDMLWGKPKRTYHMEVKSSHRAPLSKLQKKTKKKRRTKVVRVEPFIY